MTNWSGNVGVRVVRTTTLAATAESVPRDTVDRQRAQFGAELQRRLQHRNAIPQQATYTMALPSANLSYWVVPEQLQLRAAAGETMSRPDLNQLAPNATNQAINGTPELIYTGTAGLKPIKAWSVGSVARVVLPAALGAQRRAVRQESHERHLHRGHATNVDLGTTQYDRRAAGLRGQPVGHAVPLDHHGSGQRRQVDLHRHRAELAAFPGERLGHAHAVHPHLEQGLRSVRQRDRRGQRGAAHHVLGQPDLRQGPVQRGRELGLHLALHYVCSAMHRSPGVAGHRRSVLLGDGERALPDLQGLRGVRRRQEPHQRHRAHLSQRQSAAAVGDRPARGRRAPAAWVRATAPMAAASCSALRTASDEEALAHVRADHHRILGGVGRVRRISDAPWISRDAGVRGVGADDDPAGALRHASRRLACAARPEVHAAGIADRLDRGGRADAAVPCRAYRTHVPDLPHHRVVAGDHHRAVDAVPQGTGDEGWRARRGAGADRAAAVQLLAGSGGLGRAACTTSRGSSMR